VAEHLPGAKISQMGSGLWGRGEPQCPLNKSWSVEPTAATTLFGGVALGFELSLCC
jgi:hypothetical protein